MSERRFPHGDITILPQGLYDVYSEELKSNTKRNKYERSMKSD